MPFVSLSAATIAKLAGGLAVIIAIALLWHLQGYWHEQATSARDNNAATCAAVKAASGNAKLNCRDVDTQIGLIGSAVADLKRSLTDQNATIDALHAASAAQQQKAAQASQEAAGRANEATAVSARLISSSRSAPASGPCAPSKTLQEQWQ